ncbi:conserved hypothetical protein, partial [Ricinus communis]
AYYYTNFGHTENLNKSEVSSAKTRAPKLSLTVRWQGVSSQRNQMGRKPLNKFRSSSHTPPVSIESKRHSTRFSHLLVTNAGLLHSSAWTARCHYGNLNLTLFGGQKKSEVIITAFRGRIAVTIYGHELSTVDFPVEEAVSLRLRCC